MANIELILVDKNNERVVSGNIEETVVSTADRIKWRGDVYTLHSVSDSSGWTLTFKAIDFDVDITDRLT